MRSLILAALALGLTACATTIPILPNEEIVDRPPLNASARAEVGSTLVAKGNRVTRPAIVTREETGNWAVKFPPQTFLLGAQSAKYDWYMASNPVHPWIGTYQVGQAGICIGRTNPNDIGYFNSLGNCTKTKTPPVFERTTVLFEGRPSFVQELIYSGRSGSTIRLTYREFANDMARPAFTQELTYDLNEGSEIGFRGVRLIVEEATNTQIQYRVLNSFPPPPR